MKYAKVRELTCEGVRASCPECQILIVGDSSVEIYPPVYPSLGGSFVDFIDRHFFGLGAEYYKISEEMALLRQSLQTAGFNTEDLRFWITEVGTYSGRPVAPDFSSAEVAVEARSEAMCYSKHGKMNLIKCTVEKFRIILLVICAVFILFSLPASAGAPVNQVVIRERSGVAVQNYPVQIGRPFRQGEIAAYPQALVNGIPVPTQADIKCRWNDGSVKHAILSFLLPELAADSTLTVSFRNQENPENAPLTKEQMLQGTFDFDAVMELTNEETLRASARQMLENGDFEYWTEGPIATGVILADHSETRRYDIGFDEHRSFRPIFLATFWPGINKVKVRFIGEIGNTEALQDQSYSLVLKLGQASPKVVYSQETFLHPGRCRWTQQFWTGDNPTSVDIDHNVKYLASTTLVYNYAPDKEISESVIEAQYNSWLQAPKDIFAPGHWQRAMGTGGGRPDIGPYPSWHVRWLYTGDYRLAEQALGSSDLAGAWPMHYREGDPQKYLDRAQTISGLGQPMSISTRPTINLTTGLDYRYTTPEDRVVPVNTLAANSWRPDTAHQPDPYSLPYLVTGDFWYLEQGWFWASFSSARPNGAGHQYSYGRGPTGAEGGLAGQIRGQAWTLRSRVNMAAITPDSSPWKALLETWISDAVAIAEGSIGIRGTQYEGSSNWQWGYDRRYPTMGMPPLNQWGAGSESFAQEGYGIDTSVTRMAISQFEQHFMMLALGRARELGYETDALASYLGRFYVNAITHKDYNPYLIGNGRVPTVRVSDDGYFSLWSDLKEGYKVEWQIMDHFNTYDAEHGYPFLGLAATSMVAQETGGQEAWEFMANELLNAPVLSDNPKWAITPRERAVAVPNAPKLLRVIK